MITVASGMEVSSLCGTLSVIVEGVHIRTIYPEWREGLTILEEIKRDRGGVKNQ